MSIKIYTVAQMVAAERAADEAGISYAEMMETAGRRVAEAIAGRMDVHGRRVLIFVGPGNNGGDGLVAGRYLAEAGADVAFYLYKERDPQRDDNYRRIQEMGLLVVQADADQRFHLLRTRLDSSDILIDALLGTGVTRAVEGGLASLLKQVRATLQVESGGIQRSESLVSTAKITGPANDAPKRPFICAVDCPSGLNCDTGALDPLALHADLTVTFAGPKRGHFIFPGAAACGDLVVADINIPPDLPAVARIPLLLVTAAHARALLPPRPSDGHKGTFGTALIAAGSADYWGAPVLSAQGAYRAGAGLVALAVPQSIRSTAAGQVPEATYPPVPATEYLDAASIPLLLPLLEKSRAFLLGPGLGAADAFVAALLQEMSQGEKTDALPTWVVDADGLNILSRMENWPGLLPPSSILTPHPGEMSRLMGRDLADLKQMDRVELARDCAGAWGHVVLLKGAYTVVAASDGRAAQLPFANPLLAVAGSGDVLGGIITGLAAQGLPPFDAAVLGAYLHGAAAELARAEWGDAGLLSGELAVYVPEVRQRLLGDL
jgi:NAD(P)H-hydrate epimerase